jgi:hypothetical protein
MTGMAGDGPAEAEIARLVAELESAEAYEQRLRQIVIDVHDTLARGDTARALSMLNDALRLIDDQTDVVAPHDARRPPG